MTGRVVVRVIHTDEELMIAKTVCHVLDLGPKNRTEKRNTTLKEQKDSGYAY